MRVYAVDADGATLIIVAEALPEVSDADYEHLLEHVDEIIGSMAIEPAG